MAALNKGKAVKSLSGKRQSAPQKGSTTIYQGGIVMLDSSGYARPGATATGMIGAGVAVDDNGRSYWTNDGADGASDCDFLEGVFGFENSGGGDAVADDDRGKPCYIVDDQTVALTDNSGARSPAGRVVKVADSLVYVEMSAQIARQIAEEQVISTGQTYTQDYATANRTVSNPTAAAPVTITDSTGLDGTHDDTIAAATIPNAITENGGALGGVQNGDITSLVDPAGDAGASLIDGVRECATKINATNVALAIVAQNVSDLGQKMIEVINTLNALVADDLDNRQTITAIIDDLQTADIVD